MSAGITSRGWCVWLAGQFNAESAERRRARREGRNGASRGGQRHHSNARRAAAAAGHISILSARSAGSALNRPAANRPGRANSGSIASLAIIQVSACWSSPEAMVIDRQQQAGSRARCILMAIPMMPSDRLRWSACAETCGSRTGAHGGRPRSCFSLAERANLPSVIKCGYACALSGRVPGIVAILDRRRTSGDPVTQQPFNAVQPSVAGNTARQKSLCTCGGSGLSNMVGVIRMAVR